MIFECRLTPRVQLNTTAGDLLETWLILGEIVAVHIDRGLVVDGIYDTAAADPILRAGRGR